MILSEDADELLNIRGGDELVMRMVSIGCCLHKFVGCLCQQFWLFFENLNLFCKEGDHELSCILKYNNRWQKTERKLCLIQEKQTHRATYQTKRPT